MFKKLAIFDYSGTLSLDAVRFAEDENLTEELEQKRPRRPGDSGPGDVLERDSQSDLGRGEHHAHRLQGGHVPEN